MEGVDLARSVLKDPLLASAQCDWCERSEESTVEPNIYYPGESTLDKIHSTKNYIDMRINRIPWWLKASSCFLLGVMLI